MVFHLSEIDHMHTIQILAFGRPKLESLRELEKHYLTLLRPFAKLGVV